MRHLRWLRRAASLILAGALLPVIGCGGTSSLAAAVKENILTEQPVNITSSPEDPLPATPSPALSPYEDPSLAEGTDSPPAGVLAAAHAVELAEYPLDAPFPMEENYLTEGRLDYERYSRDQDAYRVAENQRHAFLAETAIPHGFFGAVASQFLTAGANPDGTNPADIAPKAGEIPDGNDTASPRYENRTCSPVNLYFALSMLTEVTDGSSRMQILRLLGAENMESLRLQASRLWNGLYTDNGVTTILPASSLWLSDRIAFRETPLRLLADLYHASSFQGSMGTPELDGALQDWLNAQTRGLLTQQAGGIRTDPMTALALAATLYCKAPWSDPFSAARTAPAVFHTREGDRNAPFMHDSFNGTCYRHTGENTGFSAVAKDLEGGKMWFFLPDAGVDADTLLSTGAAMDFIAGQRQTENGTWGEIQLSLPKFDVASDLDIINGLKAMGLTDIFDASVSDFSPLTIHPESLAVSQAKHAARVTIDEEGVEAAAFTVMMMPLSAAPERPPVIPFILDRPFLFVVEGEGKLPLFVGVVEQPLDA